MAREIDREIIYLSPSRRGVGRPSFPEVGDFIGRQLPSVRQFAIRAVTEDREGIRRSLADLKSHVPLPENPNPAEAAGLTAWFLYATLPSQFVDRAKSAYAQGDFRMFRFCFDFTTGIVNLLNEVTSTHGQLEGNTMDDRAREKWTELDRVLGTNDAERHFALARERTERGTRLLQEDPTGFLLVDNFIAQLKDRGQMEDPNQAKGYVVAGAELARDMYKAVYEVARELV